MYLRLHTKSQCLLEDLNKIQCYVEQRRSLSMCVFSILALSYKADNFCKHAVCVTTDELITV